MAECKYKHNARFRFTGYISALIVFIFLQAGISFATGSEQDETGQAADSGAVTVCLDPGHPSEVNDGMAVQNGVTENHINWIIAVEMKGVLEADGLNVVLTKEEEDKYVTNEERAAIANESEAALFFRIHCDSGPESERGMTFYYPDRQGTWDGRTGPPEELIPTCELAAYTIHDIAMVELDGFLQDRGVRTDNETYVGSRQGGALRGSILSRVPVVLVEVCFLSNADDAELVSNAGTRTIIVEALAEGIRGYVDAIEDDEVGAG